MSDSLLDATLCRSQTLFTKMNAVAPPEALGSVDVGATIVNKVTFRRVRDPCLCQSLSERLD